MMNLSFNNQIASIITKLLMLVVLLGGFAIGAEAQEAWNDTDWIQYDIITIDSSNIDEDLNDFPVYVDLSDLSSNFWGTTPSASTTVATDVRITTGTSSPYEIPRELVFASSTLETGELHFKAPFISSTTDTVFRVYYNGTTTGDYASTSNNGAHNVWTNNYTGVWHLQEDPSGTVPQMKDSTSGVSDGTTSGSMTGGDSVSGVLAGNAIEFDGSNDYIDVPNGSTAKDAFDSATQLSVSVWGKITNLSDDNSLVMTDEKASEAQFILWRDDVANTSGRTDTVSVLVTNDSAVATRIEGATNSWNTTDWKNVVVTYDSADSLRMYVDGLEDSNSPVSNIGTLESTSNPIRFGADTAGNFPANGLTDEIRVSDQVRSAGWIAAEHLNQSTTTDFYTIDTGAQVWNDTDWIQYDIITIDSSNIDEDLTDFPVYLDLSDLTDNFWSTTPANSSLVGTDIRVTTGTSSPYEIPRELVYASSTLETGELHFKAPFISSTTDTVFRVYYNGTTTGDYDVESTYGRNTVWSDYAFVFHGESLVDSTGNTGGLTNAGAIKRASGIIGEDYEYVDGGDYIYSSSVPASIDGVDPFNMSIWFEPTNPGELPLGSYVFGIADQSDAFDNYALRLSRFSDRLDFGTFDRNTSSYSRDALSINSYAGIAMFSSDVSASGSDITVINEGSVYTGTTDNRLQGSGFDIISVGALRDSSPNGADRSYLDEARIREGEISIDWKESEYVNQSSTTDFYTVSTYTMSISGSTTVDSATINLAISTSTLSVFSTSTDGSGNYSFVVNKQNLSSGDSFVLWIDGQSEKATYVGKLGPLNVDVETNLIIDTVTVSDNGGGDLTLSDMAIYDSIDDADIQFTASSTLDSLDVLGGQTLYIKTGTTLELPASTTLSGSLINNGSIDAGAGIIYSDADIPATFSGLLTGSSSLANLSVVGSGSLTINNSASTSDITIDSGSTLIGSSTPLTIGGSLTNQGTYTENGGTMYLEGSGSDDVGDASYNNESFDVSEQESLPAGISFNSDGTKVYIIGRSSKSIHAYDLSTPWDTSTATYNSESFDVSGQEDFPEDITFNSDGSKVYIVGNNVVFAYDLSTPWDISTATYNSESADVSGGQDITFSSDGSKFYIVNFGVDIIYAYDLSTPWDLNSASYNSESFSISGQESYAEGIAFNTSGTKVYIVGRGSFSSGDEAIYAYDLSTPWDISTATYDSESFIVSGQENSVRSLTFNSDDNKIYIVGWDKGIVYAYDLPVFHRSNNDNLGNVMVRGSGFQTLDDYTTVGSLIIDSGATLRAPTTTLVISGSYTNNGTFLHNRGTTTFTGTGETMSGTLTDTSSLFNSVIDGSYTMSDNASTTNLTINSGASLTAPSQLSVESAYTNNGSFDANGGTFYATADGYDIEEAIYNGESFDVNGQQPVPEGVAFNSNYTKAYIIGDSSDVIHAYDLSTAGDINTATYNSESVSVGSQESDPSGLAFNSDGTKVYVVGFNSDAIHAYDLGTAWDVSTASYNNESFSVSGQDIGPQGVFFNDDGTKVYMVGASSDSIYAYNLGVAWDVSTASYKDESFFVGGLPTDIAFNTSGSKVYVVDSSADALKAYDLSTAWDISTAVYNDQSFNVSAQNGNMTGLAFSSDGTKVNVIGKGGFSGGDEYVYVYDLPESITHAGSLINANAYHNLYITGDSSVTFTAPASTTGGFIHNAGGGSTVTLNAGDTYTFQNFNVVGTNKQLPTSLISSSKGSEWYLEVPGDATATRLYLQDSNACGSAGGGLTASTSVDGGGNTCWTFVVGNPINIEGSLYSDQGLTAITSGETIKIVSGNVSSTTVSDGSGNYTFTVEGEDLANNQIVSLFVDASSVKGTAVTRATSSVSNISNLDLYQDHLLLKQLATTTSAIDLNALSFYDSTSDSDIQFTASSTLDSLEILNSNNLYIDTDTTFDAPASTTISGSYTNNGTYLHNRGTTTFTGTGETMSGVITDTSFLYNTVIDGSYTMSDNASTTNLTINSGASLIAPSLLSVESAYTNNGSFDANGGTFYSTVEGYNLDEAVYDGGSLSVSSQESTATGLTFSSDGTKVFIVGESSDTIYAYDLSTPWDISTATYNSESFAVSGQDTDPTGLTFNDGGTKVYIVGDGSNTIYAYDLNTAWDVSTATYNAEFLDVEDATDYYAYSPDDLTFSATGDKVFITDDFTDFAFDLSVPYDVSTGVYSGELFSYDGYYDLIFNDEGTKIYFVLSNRVLLYELASPFDISSILDEDNPITYTFSEVSGIQGVSFGRSASKLFLLGGNTIYAYDLGSLSELSGNIIGDNALHDFVSDTNLPIIFTGPASTTGTFSHTVGNRSSITFNAGDSYTFQNINWRGTSSTSPLQLQSSASGTQWYLDVPGSRIATNFLSVQDSNSASAITAYNSIDKGNNVNWSFESVELVNGSTTITDHDATQVDNNFNFMNKANEPLFAFKLEPETGTSNITELVVSLSGVKEIDVADFSNIQLFKDHDNDAEYDASDELVSTGTMDITNSTGTITFATTFTSTTTQNYLITADWNYPADDSSMNLDLYGENITATDNNGIHDFIGDVSRAQHSRLSKRFSGGGGSSSAVGTPAPSGRSTTTGGTNEGGEQIGDEVGFRWPTAHSGVWSNGGHAYDQVDGTYATTDTSGATTSYQNHLFNIPNGNTVSGIEVKLEAGDGGGVIIGEQTESFINVELSHDGGNSWTTAKTTPALDSVDKVITLGSSSDTWGRSWVASDFSDSNFQVRVTADPIMGHTIELDAIQVRVYHQSTGGSSGGGGAI